MAITSFSSATDRRSARICGPLYAWMGLATMWIVWACFIVFLANPKWAAKEWPLPTVDAGGFGLPAFVAGLVDLLLIGLFGLQHSVMARPWFKQQILARLPPAFERCTFVHAANLALVFLIVCWQPIPIEVWDISGPWRDLIWVGFAVGWIILLLGAVSFGILELVGVAQMTCWYRGESPPRPRLKTQRLYRVVRHPMYVGVLVALWAAPRMTIGHLLLAAAMTLYVMIAMRYEERDLAARFGKTYVEWRSQPQRTLR
jgi:protein-S-isoprenylcysteine O-methyltransferase Ste14